jgi:steroid delta-isomerase-like uncharacterized protein
MARAVQRSGEGGARMGEDLISKAKEHVEAFNKQDWARYKEMLADDAVYEEEATHRMIRGADQIMAAIKEWTEAFPDLKSDIKEIVGGRDKVVAELLWYGTHQGVLGGPFGRIAPTGVHGQLSAVEMFTFDEEGKIARLHHFFDLMTMFEQLGVEPRPGAPAHAH